MGSKRFCGLVLLVSLVGLQSSVVQADSPVHFPWGGGNCDSTAAVGRQVPVYRTLGSVTDKHHQSLPVATDPLPRTEAYAYGWFGTNATTQWGRHFGYTKSYTQWTAR